MRTIAGYILNMIPYIFVAIPVYVIVRFIILHYSKKDFYWRHELTLLIFILFIVGLTSQTIIPKFEFGINGFGIVKSGKYRINLIPFKVLFETYHEVFVHGNINYFLINFLGNIVKMCIRDRDNMRTGRRIFHGVIHNINNHLDNQAHIHFCHEHIIGHFYGNLMFL